MDNTVVGNAIPGWRLLLFVLLRRLTPLRAVLFTTGLTMALAFPLRLAPARTFKVTATVIGMEDAGPLPIAAIQVLAGNCLLAEATPSPAGGATFVLPAGDYGVSARTNGNGQADGWSMDKVMIHVDRDLSVAINHDMILPSDLYSMRVAPPAHCMPSGRSP
jgi:hypothetical protein